MTKYFYQRFKIKTNDSYIYHKILYDNSTKEKAIQTAFFFYQNLYKQLLLPNNTSFSFLQNLSKLSLQNNNLLTSSITLKEIIDLIKILPNNKIPEPDGIIYEFYKIFIHSLDLSMVKFFN